MPSSPDPTQKILRPGKTCWQAPVASRAAILVDARAYFEAFTSAVAAARQSVLIVGWDIDSRVELRRDGREQSMPRRLGDFLNAVVSRRKKLQIHVLAWDFAMIYALERESMPVFQLGWRTHRRIHFHLDNRHPVGASHHQKIVVVDDAVAFAGGIDLTKRRWDTPAHMPRHRARRDPTGEPYPPFHDAQMAVSGEAAAVLGDLVRDRWERATGSRPEAPTAGGDPWPRDVVPDFEDVGVGVARTYPSFGGRSEVREVEMLYHEAIGAARRFVYIENQYLTSRTICETLAARLREVHGPEVVLVVPRRCSGWLEESTMGALRGRVLDRLRAADRFGRLHVYYPRIGGVEDESVNVHAKILVVDDLLLRVGSANLSNRSMGLDTECDLALEGVNGEIRAGIAAVHHRLLGEHLGASPRAVTEAVGQRGSLAAAVEALGNESRGLRPLPREPSWTEPILADTELADPERPAAIDRLIAEFDSRERRGSGRRLLAVAAFLVTFAALAAAWRWTPLGQWITEGKLVGVIGAVAASPLAPLWVLGAYLVGGLVSLPLVLLIVVTAVVFGPLLGFLYALAGAMASALTFYGLGRWLGRDTVRRFAGRSLNRVSRRLAKRGFLAMLVVRVVPLAPFTVVNLVAGASHIRFRDFALGSLAGMTPGTFAIAIFGDRLEAAVVHPGLWSYLLLGALAALVLLGIRWMKRRVDG